MKNKLTLRRLRHGLMRCQIRLARRLIINALALVRRDGYYAVTDNLLSAKSYCGGALQLSDFDPEPGPDTTPERPQ